MALEYDAADFKDIGPTEGMFKLEVMGQVEEIEYTAKNYINKAGTIGYAAVNVDEKIDFMFISNTGAGVVLTVPGDTPGPLPFPIAGYKAVTITDTNFPIEQIFSGHIEAMGDEDPIADEAWLRKEVPQIPYRVSAVLSQMFETALKAMGDMMEGMGQALGQAMGQVVGGLQETFGGEEAVLEEGVLCICPECNYKVREETTTCPHCEAPLGEDRGGDGGGGLVCIGCGAKIEPGDRTCPNCGENLD